MGISDDRKRIAGHPQYAWSTCRIVTIIFVLEINLTHSLRFYGAASDLTMRPEVSYADLRNASGNTGNVEENKSLYWNPAIYKVVNQNSNNKMYQIVDVWFASAYYVWRTGQAKAFPNGLKMKTSDNEELARVEASCDGESACERADKGGCKGYGPSNQKQHGFLPIEACSGTMIP